MNGDRLPTMEDLRERNRRVVRVLLTIMATLIVASLLVGVRW
jgi:hypothetical protein